MLIQQWLTALQSQLRMRSTLPRRGRHSRNQRLKTPSAQALVSRNVIETLEDRTLLTALTVLNTDDSGAGSLRAAVEAANTNAGADTISFDAALAGQTIVLTSELLISDHLTITGLGANLLTLDGDNNSRIFSIDDDSSSSTITVEISGLTLTNGNSNTVDTELADNGGAIFSTENLTIENCIFTGNTAGSGGAIYDDASSLTVRGSQFIGNTAEESDGGAIYHRETFPYPEDGELVLIENSQFTGNHARLGGGAVLLRDGIYIVNGSTFIENTAEFPGGAISNVFGDLTVNDSSFIENHTDFSGGAINNSGMLFVSGSTFDRNTADVNGGGIYSQGSKSVTIYNSTFSGNSSVFNGGGIFALGSKPVTVINSTIVNNVATGSNISKGGGIYLFSTAPTTISNTIIAGNDADSGHQVDGDFTGTANIIQESITGLLDPELKDNGGLTKTYALLSDSAAINAGQNSAATSAGLTTDQRGTGFPRIFDGIVDIGAFELQSLHFLVDSATDTDDGDYSAGNLSLREAIKLSNESDTTDTITFDASLFDQTLMLFNELVITDDVTIIGLGADQLTLDGDGNSRIFNIDDGNSETRITVEISGLTLSNGSAEKGGAIYNLESLSILNATLSGNSAERDGAGIYSSAGLLTVKNSRFQENGIGDGYLVYYGGAIYQDEGILTVIDSEFIGNESSIAGGAIYTDRATGVSITGSTFQLNLSNSGGALYLQDGPLTVSQCDFMENEALSTNGGAIFCFGTSFEPADDLLLIENSQFTQNDASSSGGAIQIILCNLTVTASTFTENRADSSGGAIAQSYGNLSVFDSSFYENRVYQSGGAISFKGQLSSEDTLLVSGSTFAENKSYGNAGAISAQSANTVKIYNSTVSGNKSESDGGGIYLIGGDNFTITNCTIVGNTAKNYTGGGIFVIQTYLSFSITNSIVSGNTAGFTSYSQIRGRYTGLNNLIGSTVSLLLDPVLRDNGGPTKTHALIAGSSAINAGDNTRVIDAGLEFDQRGIGFDRIVGTAVDIGAYEVDAFYAQFDLRIVGGETPTSATGEAEELPTSLLWIDEWGSYWLEIWISTPSTTDRGILSAALQLSYNTSITTATGIEYGKAFSNNQTGTINDQTGTVENLSAESSLTDAGDDQYVLFARIRFESTEQDGIDLDLEGKSLSPQRPDFEIVQSEIIFSDGSDSSEVYGTEPYTKICANPFDLNDDDVINHRDLIHWIGVYGVTPSESSSDYAWFADYDQNDRVNYRDLIQLIGNYGKSKTNARPVNYSAFFPYAWNQLLTVESQQSPPSKAESVTQTAAEAVLESVVEQVSPQLDSEQQQILSEVDIKVVDLAAGTLGRAVPGTIYIDVNAAGYGWFVDATPTDNSEFSTSSELSLIALPDSKAAGHVDLWTVILHELGHLLGYEHADDGVMQESLATGERRLADWESETDAFFGTLTDDAELSVF